MSKGIAGLARTRANMIARTETIYAHAEGQLDSFEELNIREVGVMAEWLTAGDEDVCLECEALEGTVMTIEEARGLLPRHPNCRCAWIPANVGERQPGRAWTGKQKEKRVQASLQAEMPGASLRRARAGSVWLGKEKSFQTIK
jgi:SPP1 gp7 family putative phage head morphogenesis protein